MRGKIAICTVTSVVFLMVCGAVLSTPGGSIAPSLGTEAAGAAATVDKGASGGGGNSNANAAGERFGEWLRNNATPVLIAFSGCSLVSVLFSRNLGAGVGIVMITLVSLMFLLAPDSIAGFAKGVANIIF